MKRFAVLKDGVLQVATEDDLAMTRILIMMLVASKAGIDPPADFERLVKANPAFPDGECTPGFAREMAALLGSYLVEHGVLAPDEDPLDRC